MKKALNQRLWMQRTSYWMSILVLSKERLCYRYFQVSRAKHEQEHDVVHFFERSHAIGYSSDSGKYQLESQAKSASAFKHVESNFCHSCQSCFISCHTHLR